MPTRKIRKSYRNVTGVLASKKNARMVASESTLERDLYQLLEFDPLIERYEEQPVTLPYRISGEQLSRYTPDVVIFFSHPPNFIWRYSPFRALLDNKLSHSNTDSLLIKPKSSFDKPRVILAEVKYRGDLFKSWKELKPKFKAARLYAKERNWQFRIFTELEIRSQILRNIKFIRPFQRYTFPVEEMLRILDKLAELERCLISDLLNAISVNNHEYANLIPIIWHLISLHEIEVEWNKPLTLCSVINSVI